MRAAPALAGAEQKACVLAVTTPTHAKMACRVRERFVSVSLIVMVFSNKALIADDGKIDFN